MPYDPRIEDADVKNKSKRRFVAACTALAIFAAFAFIIWIVTVL